MMFQFKWYCRGIGQGYSYATRIPCIGERILIGGEPRLVMDVEHNNLDGPWLGRMDDFVAASVEVA